MNFFRLLCLLLTAAVLAPARLADAQPTVPKGFLISPLACGDSECRLRYPNPYTPGMMSGILDHSMVQDDKGSWPYGSSATGGGDGVLFAFNGEVVQGRASPADSTCVGGTIKLHPDSGVPPMTNSRACGPGFSGHDEHPGYDYRAALGTRVRAAGTGRVLNLDGQSCFRGYIRGDCSAWGYVGIDHGNGYITQYGHLSRIDVRPGQRVVQGQSIGLSGHTAPTPVPDHLHFEVLRIVDGDFLVVDPYGWVGSGRDPLYSAARVSPRNLWGEDATFVSRFGVPLADSPAAPARRAGRPAEPRVALVVGVSQYGSLGHLPNPVNDAKALAVVLKTLGFEVDLLLDPDQKLLKQAVAKLGDRMIKAGPSSTALFFFAGHGIQSKGTNYLIPSGASIKREADLDLEAVTADTVLAQMQDGGVSTSIVILDACRNMPLTRSFRGTGPGLAEMSAPNGSFIAYSTAPGAVAADGEGANSPFAAALLREMTRPGEPIEAVFRNVRRSVLIDTGGEQRPWDSSSLIAPFYFLPEG